jgi:hypothetical protein
MIRRTRSLLRLATAAAALTSASAGAQTLRPGASPGDADTARAAGRPTPGTAVTRTAEADSPAPRDRLCAQRVRVPATGREYLLRRSVTEERTARAGDTTTVTYGLAVGQYEALGAPSPPGSEAAAIWVDCRSMRVVAAPAGS